MRKKGKWYTAALNSKERRRDMAIYQRGKIWYISYQLNGKRVRKAMGTRKDKAVAVMENIKVSIRGGRYHEEEFSPVPFEQLYEKYNECAKERKSFKAVKAQREACLEYFRGRTAQSITVRDIEGFIAFRRNVPVRDGKTTRTNATINRELAALKAILNKGVTWGFLNHNPATKVKMLPESKGRTRFLTVEEVSALLNAASAHLRPILIVALQTGMRRGEILKLKWSDVDMKNSMIYVGDTKTGIPRHIPMSSHLRDTLKALPRRLGVDYVFAGSTVTIPEMGKHKRPWNTTIGKAGKPFRDVTTSFRNALARAGITGFRFHDLRHTAASHMVMAGIPMKTVGEILGHSTVSVTERYSHLTPEHKRQAIETLSACYNAECPKTATNEKRLQDENL